MSEQFKVIYKMLSILAKSMDYPEFDAERLSAESLGVSEPMRLRLLEMLLKKGYIEGIQIRKYIDESYPVVVGMENIQITMDGLAYLEENSLMKKASDIAKGIIDVLT